MDMVPPGGNESRVGAVEQYRLGLRHILPRKEDTILLVLHEFPLGVILGATRNENPADCEHHFPYATPYFLSETEVRRAANHLKGWLEGWKQRA